MKNREFETTGSLVVVKEGVCWYSPMLLLPCAIGLGFLGMFYGKSGIRIKRVMMGEQRKVGHTELSLSVTSIFVLYM